MPATILKPVRHSLRSALFHCQQCAEKALKAFLTWHDVPFRKVHELEELGVQCRQIDSTLAPFVEGVEPLTKYVSRFRYPGAPYTPSLEEGQAALALARGLLEVIGSRLPLAVRP
jgi:HEPN domain-containing protein